MTHVSRCGVGIILVEDAHDLIVISFSFSYIKPD